MPCGFYVALNEKLWAPSSFVVVAVAVAAAVVVVVVVVVTVLAADNL